MSQKLQFIDRDTFMIWWSHSQRGSNPLTYVVLSDGTIQLDNGAERRRINYQELTKWSEEFYLRGPDHS